MRKIVILIVSVLGICVFSGCEDKKENEVYKHYKYDFNDGSLSGWSGTATADIINGKLHLSSISGYKWHTIAYDSSPHYTAGSVELDIFPKNGSYTFSTKGTSIEDYSFNWGIRINFKNDSLFSIQNSNGGINFLFTDYIYEQNVWYYLKINFNSDAGDKGKYDLYITSNKDHNGEIFLGTFDYYASHGRMWGINQFVLNVGDPEKEISMEGIYDNINFYLKQNENSE